ncbi:MAG: CidA/LrgA family protein [Tissierellia bacterium]|nr:CidA/LrgA family protein [Tissierellia bacterium]
MKKIIKTLIQLSIILLIYFVGNFISSLIENIIVIPGNIIGMVLLFILLATGLIKLSMIEETGDFIIRYMGFFFVPLTVSLVESYNLIESSIFQIVIILFISCTTVMFFSAKVTDYLISFREKNND